MTPEVFIKKWNYTEYSEPEVDANKVEMLTDLEALISYANKLYLQRLQQVAAQNEIEQKQ